MIDKNIEPNSISYSLLINWYYKKKKMVEAMQLFHEISQRDLNLILLPTILSCIVCLKLEKLVMQNELMSTCYLSRSNLIHALMTLFSVVSLSMNLLKKLCISLIDCVNMVISSKIMLFLRTLFYWIAFKCEKTNSNNKWILSWRIVWWS